MTSILPTPDSSPHALSLEPENIPLPESNDLELAIKPLELHQLYTESTFKHRTLTTIDLFTLSEFVLSRPKFLKFLSHAVEKHLQMPSVATPLFIMISQTLAFVQVDKHKQISSVAENSLSVNHVKYYPITDYTTDSPDSVSTCSSCIDDAQHVLIMTAQSISFTRCTHDHIHATVNDYKGHPSRRYSYIFDEQAFLIFTDFLSASTAISLSFLGITVETLTDLHNLMTDYLCFISGPTNGICLSQKAFGTDITPEPLYRPIGLRCQPESICSLPFLVRQLTPLVFLDPQSSMIPYFLERKVTCYTIHSFISPPRTSALKDYDFYVVSLGYYVDAVPLVSTCSRCCSHHCPTTTEPCISKPFSPSLPAEISSVCLYHLFSGKVDTRRPKQSPNQITLRDRDLAYAFPLQWNSKVIGTYDSFMAICTFGLAIRLPPFEAFTTKERHKKALHSHSWPSPKVIPERFLPAEFLPDSKGTMSKYGTLLRQLLASDALSSKHPLF